MDRQPQHRVTIDGPFAESVAKRIYGRIFAPDSWNELPVGNRVQLIEQAWDLLDGAAEEARDQGIVQHLRGQLGDSDA